MNITAIDCENSTCVSDATYSPDSEALTVTYRGTQDTYRYNGVSEDEGNEFLSSDSKGTSLMGIIEGKSYEKL